MKPAHAEALCAFHLSPAASKTYLALLDAGSASADELARAIGTYKANTYAALERLMEEGLATSVHEGRRRVFRPTDPRKLLNAADDAQQKREAAFLTQKERLARVLPEWTAAFESTRQKDAFEVYRGRKAYRALIQDILRENPKEWKGFGNLQVQAYFPTDFPKWFRRTRIRLFSSQSPVMDERLKEARKYARVDIQWLHSDVFMPIVWTLFGDNLLILIYEPDVIALRIKSEPVVKTFSSQFEYLWSGKPVSKRRQKP